MAQTIKLKRSATAGAEPTPSQLELGEVAINTYDGKMYIKKSVAGTESIVEISGGDSGTGIIDEFLYTATAGQTAFSGNDDNSDFLSYVTGAIQVFLNGILLDPETDYTATNGALLTLTSAASANDYLQIFSFKKKISDGNVTVDSFSGNNSTTAFTLSIDPGDENNTRVFVDGVYQSKANYTVSGTTLTFSTAPPSGTAIEVESGNRSVTIPTTENLDFPDNVKLRLGTSQDLEIYHDASDSLINDNGTGSLKLQTGGSTKLEVTSTGVDVTGNIAVSGTVDGIDIAARDGVLTSTTTTAGAALPRTGGAMTGAITTNSTFDGRDVATDGAKLDGIEAGATADQTQSEINALGITATGLSGTPAISVANITTTGELRGPASFTIDPAAVGDNTGTVIIKGNLQVDGATTTINSTTLTVDDLNLTLASGAANGTAANGAGITIDGASATLTYASVGDNWAFNKNLDVTGNIVVSGTVDGVDIAARDAVLTSTTTTAGAALPKAGGTMTGTLTIAGGSSGADLYINNTSPTLGFTDSNSFSDASDMYIVRAGSTGDLQFQFFDDSANTTTTTFQIDETGNATFAGNISVTGTVDGVDIAARDAVLTSTTTTAGAALPKAGGTMTGNLAVPNLSVTSTNWLGFGDYGERISGSNGNSSLTFYTDATLALTLDSLQNATFAGNITVGGTVDGVDIAARDAVLTSTTTTAGAALPKAGGTMTGDIFINGGSTTERNVRIQNTANVLYAGVEGSSGNRFLGSSAGNAFFGTTSDSGLEFATHNNVRMVIDGDGKVGIGTDSPSSGLHLTGDDNTKSKLTLTNTAPSLDNTWSLHPIYNGQDLRLNEDSDTRVTFQAGGNVGIGTTSPNTTLTLSDGTDEFDFGVTTNQLMIKSVTSDASDDQRIIIDAGNGGQSSTRGAFVALSGNEAASEAGKAIYQMGNVTGSAHVFRKAGGVDAVTIDSSGNVGIGTTDPVGNLHIVGGDGVNGSSTIGASSNEFIIENNSDAGLTIRSGANENGVISFADPDDHNVGQVYYSHDTDKMSIVTNDAVQMTIDSAGTVDVVNDILTNNAKLKAIAESNTDTAVDVFVYDTRKDSDGGAWRKRTQNTSWYNETLNTSTRGARKEFPSVAVIVAEAAQVTIYDGDDPDMPMWMVFNGSSIIYQATRSSLAILNGIMFTGGSTSVTEINFLTEFMGLHQASAISQTKPSWAGGIVNRNDTGGNWTTEGAGTGSVIKSGTLVNQATNDVAMTVLPNAPIDADTGLPVPTIAVATNGGVSIIKDDGTVVDITASAGSAYNGVGFISFDSNHNMIFEQDNIGRSLFYMPIPSADTTSNTSSAGSTDKKMLPFGSANTTFPKFNGSNATLGIGGSGEDQYIHGGTGVTHYAQGPSDANSSVAYITSDYNTGWMVGDIKLATLSDTDTTNAVSANMAGNGNFADTSVWGPANGASFSVSGNVATITANGSTTQAYIGQIVSGLTVGKQYMITCDAKRGTTSAGAAITVNGILSAQTSSTSFYPLHVTFTATATSQLVLCFLNGTGSQSGTALFQNFTFRSVEADRSVNGAHPQGGNALQVFGTVTKTAVATGAELVGYSGWSTSSYLQQPYNSDLDFGTGDFSVSFWGKGADSSAVIFERGNSNLEGTNGTGGDNSGRLYIVHNTTLSVVVGTANSGATGFGFSDGVWNQVTIVRRSGVVTLYVDGAEKHSFASTHSVGASTHISRLGRGIQYNSVSYGGSLALWRISATAPTVEQIKKMYNDEKHLFQENAKATLYGTSDAVTALAYDDDTELLHAGTSAGRSVFQGLNRVDNTTDAVGSAISASNGFIVEE